MNNKKSSNKIKIGLFIVSLLLIVVTMFSYIAQKEGFHEDEIYSYGSSNYKYNDTFYASADRDATNRVVAEYIIADDFKTTFKNFMYYRSHPCLRTRKNSIRGSHLENTSGGKGLPRCNRRRKN